MANKRENADEGKTGTRAETEIQNPAFTHRREWDGDAEIENGTGGTVPDNMGRYASLPRK